MVLCARYNSRQPLLSINDAVSYCRGYRPNNFEWTSMNMHSVEVSNWKKRSWRISKYLPRIRVEN
jgi:hypothetical protein